MPWFREELRKRNIRVHASSALGRALGAIDAFHEKIRHNDRFSFPSTDAAYEFYAELKGIDFLTKALHWGHATGFDLDQDRWQMLGRGDPLVSRSTSKSTKDRNQTWESVIASLSATFATNIAFDEPDVTCVYNARRYAIAAKVAYGSKSVVERIREGFEQAQGKGDAALVFVDVAAIYPVVEGLRWSRKETFQTPLHAVESVKTMVGKWCDDEWHLPRIVESLRKASPKQPVGVAFFVPLVLHIHDQPCSFFYVHMPVSWTGNSGPDYEFAKAFLGACNDVTAFGLSTQEVLPDAPVACTVRR
jgi:hypothetical protein